MKKEEKGGPRCSGTKRAAETRGRIVNWNNSRPKRIAVGQAKWNRSGLAGERVEPAHSLSTEENDSVAPAPNRPRDDVAVNRGELMAHWLPRISSRSKLPRCPDDSYLVVPVLLLRRCRPLRSRKRSVYGVKVFNVRQNLVSVTIEYWKFNSRMYLSNYTSVQAHSVADLHFVQTHSGKLDFHQITIKITDMISPILKNQPPLMRKSHGIP